MVIINIEAFARLVRVFVVREESVFKLSGPREAIESPTRSQRFLHQQNGSSVSYLFTEFPHGSS
jgi:hypothetical protein